MAYEIPQELQYEEQIMFGLTTKQLLISLPFIPFAIIPFKLDLHIFGQVVLALIPVSLAGVCMFTQLPKQFWNWWTWRANRYFFLDSLKMRDLLEVKKIEKTVVKLKENNISIIKVEPINFGIKNKKEKEAIILAFQKFLNSLDFPIQIVMGTNPLNLDDYLSKLEERSKKVDQKYASLFRSYQTYLTKLVKRDGLFDRVFYLVIPEKGDVGLKVQIGVCKELLKRIGVKYKLLSGEALTDCLSSFFQDLFTDSDRESKEDVLNTIAPNELINYPKDLRSGDIFMRTIAVRGYPRSVEPGFLDRIISLSGDFDLSIHIEPYPIDSMMVSLNKELQKQRADLWAGEQKAMVNPSLEIKYKDTRSVLENLQKGDEKLFNVSLYITCKGNSEENLNLLCKRMESELNAIMMIPKIPKYEMHKGLKSVIPIGKDVLSVKRNITTKPLSAFFPFTSQFLDVEDSGIWLGLNKNHIPIIKDIFKLHNANGVVLASSGGGKSYFTKLMISRHLLNGAKVIVVDPQGEYVDLAKRFDGQVVNISRDSNTLINPMDLMGHDLGEKKLTLLDLIPIMLGEITEMQRAVLDKAIGATYQAAGITDHKKTWTKAPPL
ncbi:MAG: VirB4 family type IV secretion system protein, partial [Candidatus Nanoarchaeia archaeon]